jgi:hypothetical protein
MMVVAARYGRRGLGTRLMRHVLGLAQGAVVYLMATDQGRPLYERLGFRAIDTLTRHSGVFVPAGDGARTALSLPVPVRQVTAADLGALAPIDRQVFGADRRRLLAELVTFADVFVTCGQPQTGYGAAWRNGDAIAIGPVVAAGQAAAADLIGVLATGWDRPVRLDVAGRHAGLSAWAEARGLAASSQTALMVRGGDLPGDRARLFAPANVAIG